MRHLTDKEKKCPGTIHKCLMVTCKQEHVPTGQLYKIPTTKMVQKCLIKKGHNIPDNRRCVCAMGQREIQK